VEPDAELRWSQLDRLPLRQLTYRGRDPAVLAWLASSQVRDFGWLDHGQPAIDLRETRLEDLVLEPAAGLGRLALPDSLSRLCLVAPLCRELEVSGAGPDLALCLSCGEEPPVLPRGLEGTRHLTVLNPLRLELARLAELRDLEQLKVIGAPAVVADLHLLKRHPRLRSLELRDCYDLGDGALAGPEQLPALERLELDGVRAADAERFERVFGGGSTELAIRGVRDDAWISENVHNPFRDWDRSRPAAVARQARDAWRRAAEALGRQPDRAEPILRAMIEAFNALDPDTTAREEIADAFHDLAGQAGLSEATAEQWFDRWRDF